MAKNRRKSYDQAAVAALQAAKPCPVCGCRHFDLEHEVHFEGRECTKRITRRVCRNCGREA